MLRFKSQTQEQVKMMHVDVVTLIAIALCFPLLTSCDPLFVLSAPNLLRVGSSENVFVEAQDYPESGGNLNVRISVKNYPKKDRELLSKTVTLTGVNNYQILTDIKIPDDQNYFSDDPLEKQYVYLQAQFPTKTLEKVVMVSFQSGYIFVQTDKPIYTPSSTVNYRVFSLTPDQHPLDGVSVSVDIMNPQGITLDRDKFLPRGGIRAENFALPEIASAGVWKLIAKYSNTPQKNFTTEFEVLEYVLPSFEVTLNPSKPFFYVNESSLTVGISAKYLFGNKVRGSAFVVFGVIDNEKKISIAASLQRVQIFDGEGEAELTGRMVKETFPDLRQLIGKSLYISASVLTETGSEMVEAHRRGIQIVTSPYTIYFKRTPQFFKPGMSFDVSVYVTNPDQTPAQNVEVEVNPGQVRGRTKANGIAKVTVNTPGGASTLQITAKTNDPQLKNDQQATRKMTAMPYIPKGGSKNYLHIGIDAAELQIGDQIKVNLNLGNSPGVTNQDFTYLILSKGQIVQADRFKRRGQTLVSLSLPVTKDMVPSFRFVAYYHVGTSEVVSDSVWVDVKDTCMGTLKVEVKDHAQFGPGDKLSLIITGDPGAKVGLVAVDKGVYVLNDKNRLTQTKIWDIIEKHDTGCTAGSGRDSMGVFTDAGLMFESNTAEGTNTRTNNECPAPPKRKRRAESLLQVTTTLAGKYSGEIKKCCVDGMQETKLGYSCERRATYILDGEECVQAFLHCCKVIKDHRSTYSGEEEMYLSRSEDDDIDDEPDDVLVRTQFPETWLWEEIDLPPCPPNQSCDKTSASRNEIYLKDSITTWQITAISLSKTLGICVANPYEITVKKDFFIDLRMPFSAVRNEQLEIKAIVHNYGNQKLKVHIKFKTSEGICSSARKKQTKKDRIIVAVGSMSSVAVPLIIIPMDLHDQWIEAEAYSSNRNDAIRKNLKVVSEGVLTEVEERVVEINPSEHPGSVQVVSMRSDIPRRKVPNTPASTLITVIGEEITRTVEQAISGHFMGQLIVQPHGCGEQTMIFMTLPLIATHYLDSTKQWEAVGINRRNDAINHISTGYKLELTFRKSDGSYSAWKSSPSSTWLTAYVAKVFAMASDLVVIEENVICSALKWLAVNKQQPDGTFKEDAPVYHSEMVGNVQGNDADASLTAFVLIAMQEGHKICAKSVQSLQGSINRAVNYLTLRVHSLTSGYAVAMTSYALAHAGKLDKNILMSHSTQNQDAIFWQVPGQHYHSLEATGYAVLALTMAKDFERAGRAVRWLGKQQSNYGGYGSTQATIMVFQAVAEYRIQVKKADINLDLELAVQERSGTKKIAIRGSNINLARTDKFDITKSFKITAQGTGVAMLSVFSVYYALPEEKDGDCKVFDLSVQMEKQLDVSYDGAIESYQLTIEYIFKDPLRSSTMSILDIGLLTGFKVDERDLSKLSSGKDKYIQSFELNKELSERGSLIIYIDKISHKQKERIVFRIHKLNEVGMLQPAGVTVYEYNAPDKRCVKFYHPQKRDGALNRLCSDELCQCAEENCSLQKNEHIDEDNREKKACESEVEYVYKTRLLEMSFSLHADIYNMTVEQVLKEGTDSDAEGNMRSFLGHPYCRDFLKFEKGKTYLVMGQTKTLPKIGGKLRYHLGEDTWIEYWPTNKEGQKAEHREKFIGLTSLADKLTRFGCST
ncbi:complement C3 [Pimephales promelas]|uniref:complement C3 n=1 Tax=Pimephales promelas TaxID=90988 RepID=UPI00195570D5|nr:complement C3 [Pimephales promelas]KAG1955856.1 complement C3 preproprotein [Pimephales promelas]